ncbi:hypothetical protein PFAG_03527 [Plasmodium falciparum Santa Lucia]|nr:hypothetical protein PFAG_03527 [Plasmodium falciparum Santa Lucia]
MEERLSSMSVINKTHIENEELPKEVQNNERVDTKFYDLKSKILNNNMLRKFIK